MLASATTISKISQLCLKPEIIAVLSTVTLSKQKILDRLAGKTTEQEKVMYIKAIGNSASLQAQPALQKILKDRDEPLYIRVECVWAHRHIIRQARQIVSNMGP